MSRPRVRFGEGRVLQLRAELDAIQPPIWRRLLVSERASLRELHDIIEHAMQRGAGGAYEFVIDGVRYADTDAAPLGHDAAGVALQTLGLRAGARLQHVSDVQADPWRHVITIEQVTSRLVGQRLPSCIGAARAAPPEDCAGPVEYLALLRSRGDSRGAHSAAWRDWLPENFDPDYADVTAINAALAKVRKHRPAA